MPSLLYSALQTSALTYGLMRLTPLLERTEEKTGKWEKSKTSRY